MLKSAILTREPQNDKRGSLNLAAQILLLKIQKPEIALRFICCIYIAIKNYSCVDLSLSFVKKNLIMIGKVVTRTIIRTMISNFFFKSIPN